MTAGLGLDYAARTLPGLGLAGLAWSNLAKLAQALHLHTFMTR